MRWRSQGLSDHRRWPHGRGWLYLGSSKAIRLEWSLGGLPCGVSLDLNWVDGCDGIMLYIGIPFIGRFYVVLEHIVPKRWLPKQLSVTLDPPVVLPVQRTIGITVHDQSIWFKAWANPMEWRKDQPWWWEFTISPLDILLGRRKHTRREISEGVVHVWMPEGIYPAKYKVFESVWKRPRWPKVQRVVRMDVEMEQSIPFSGKGENGWDLGEDGIWSMTISTDSPQDAAREIARDVLETRRKRGDPRKWPVAPGVAE